MLTRPNSLLGQWDSGGVCRFSTGPNCKKFLLKLYLLIIRLAENHARLHAGSSRHYSAGVHIRKSSFNLVIDGGYLSVSGDVEQCSKYGHITHHRPHAKYDYTKSRLTAVMRIWNVDAQQRQRYLTWAELCYIMSVSKTLSICLLVLYCFRRIGSP